MHEIMERLDLIALGGNAILPVGKTGTIKEQMTITSSAMEHIAGLVGAGRNVVLTHGNGPIVGNIVIRNEAARKSIPPMPLDVCGADSQGGIGYMIQQALGNALRARGVEREVVSVVTQVCVAEDDPAFDNPVKPIGPFYSEKDARRIEEKRGWTTAPDAHGQYRRVVASPHPIDIVEKHSIQRLVEQRVIVVAVGGGGIPVVRVGTRYEGREAVVDKDLSSSLLARALEAERMIILTDIAAVYKNFRSDDAEALRRVGVAEVKSLYAEGQFPPGSMGAKILAAIEFLEAGGEAVIVCSADDMEAALEGNAGTTIVRQL